MSKSTTIDVRYLFASSTAGLVARTITHPMDTIKTRLQTTTMQGTHAQLLRTVVFQQPISTLYRGLPVTLLFSVPALSIYLTCYEASKQALRRKGMSRDSVWSHLISGCAAEVSAGLLFTPMEVIKNRLQTATAVSPRLISQIYNVEGVRGFFKGYWMGLAVFVPHSMCYFATYEKMKQLLLTDQHHPAVYMISSSVAGFTSILLSTPLDIIKTRWQISASDHGSKFRKGPFDIFQQMLSEKGAFTRGLWARVAWGLPTTAISMTVFELLKSKHSLK